MRASFRTAVAALSLCLPFASADAQTPVGTPASMAPPAPDYALAQNWAARPGSVGAADAVAGGAIAAARAAGVDVFYVHPTTDKSTTQWNQDVADAAVDRWTDDSVIARQAGAFNACCRVFAPRYRQSTVAAFRDPVIRKAAFAVAYGDVVRAFDDYLRRDNHGRPFILVGHSQGASHIAELLEERIDGTHLARQLVAAYVIGGGLTEGDFGRSLKSIPACDTPAQTGCVAAWNSVLETMPNPQKFAALIESGYVERYGDVPGKTLTCINPLTFDRSKPSAPATASRGAVPGTPGVGPLKPLVRHQVAAHCDNGMLRVTPAASLDLTPLPGGSMHYHDIGLFYEDVRENAVLRARAYLKQHHAK